MLKAELIDKKGYPIAIVRQVCDWTHSFGGFITLVTSWDARTNEVGDEDFLATCSIKWDGCSHFWYNDQDYLADGSRDAYYHECGLNEYYKVFVAKLFAFEVAKHYMKDTVEDIEQSMNDNLYNTIDKVNILDFYTIKYSQIDRKNDFIYQNYLKRESL